VAQPIYTLSINDGPPLDSEAGRISVIEKEQANQALGHLTLKIFRFPDQPFLFEHDQIITVFQDGVRIFRGISDSPVAVFSSTDIGHLHTIRDMWHACASPFRKISALPTHGAFTNSMWQLLSDFVDAVLPQYFSMCPWPESVTVRGYGVWPGINGPLYETILVLLRTEMFAATSWDYSAQIPVLRLLNRGDVVRTLDRTIDHIEDIDLSCKLDAVPTSIELVSSEGSDWLGEMSQVYPMDHFDGPDTLFPAGSVRGQYGSVMLVDPGGNLTTVANRAAEALMGMVSTPAWVGSVTIQDPDGACKTGIYPGMTLNFTGNRYKAEWASCNAVVMSVKEDFKLGKTTLTLGQTGRLTPQTAWERCCALLGGRAWVTTTTSRPFQIGWLPILGAPLPVPMPGAGTNATAVLLNVVDTGPGGAGISGQIAMTSGFGGYSGSNLVQLFFNFAATASGTAPIVTVTPANAAAMAALAGQSIAGGQTSPGVTSDNFQLTITGTVAVSEVLLFNFTITPTQVG